MKSRRIGLGLSQAELANKSGVSLRSIVSWEKGGYRPNGKFLERIAEALGCDPAWLLNGDEPTAKATLEPSPPYRTNLPPWLRDINARLLALEPAVQTLAIEKIHEVLTALLNRKTLRLETMAEIEPQIMVAFDDIAPELLAEAIRRERAGRRTHEKPSPTPSAGVGQATRK